MVFEMGLPWSGPFCWVEVRQGQRLGRGGFDGGKAETGVLKGMSPACMRMKLDLSSGGIL